MMTVDTTDDIGHSLKGKSVISAGVVIDFINDLFVLDLKKKLYYLVSVRSKKCCI